MDRKTFLSNITLATLSLHMSSLHSLSRWSETLKSTERMPVFFIGHGSPMNALEENVFVRGFREMASSIPQTPQAILCISAHWFTRGTKVTGMMNPPTIHDFGGFPQALFDVQYPAPGNPELAHEIVENLANFHADVDHQWGLDHGTWSILKHMYPAANIPVVQLSIDFTKSASYHFQLAQELKELRNKGVLIIGSGNIVHNLSRIDWPRMNDFNHGFDWALEVRSSVNDYLMKGDFQPLIQYDLQGAAWKNAIPSPDHYLPLIYTLGLADPMEEKKLYNDYVMAGSLSMTSIKFG